MVSVSNQRLRNALVSAGITQADLAERVQVDAKSVERWITQERMPHATTRARVAQVLRQEETYFWPQLLGTEQTRNATNSELVQVWPTRGDVPGDVWRSLFAQATTEVDLLVYSGGFLIEAHNLIDTIEVKAAGGTTFRVLLGDPRCEAVRLRSKDEGLPSLPERCRSSQEYLRHVADLPGVHIRIHQTTLYASQYRFDESMLVNSHTYGSYAAQAPVLHLRRVPGGRLFNYYDRAFERVWATGEPLP
jgi:transcriptional regulator with XRE-family HTH domain